MRFSVVADGRVVGSRPTVVAAYKLAARVRDGGVGRVEVWGEGLVNGPVLVLLERVEGGYEVGLDPDAWVRVLGL
jgi:hypothetical protein